MPATTDHSTEASFGRHRNSGFIGRNFAGRRPPSGEGRSSPCRSSAPQLEYEVIIFPRHSDDDGDGDVDGRDGREGRGTADSNSPMQLRPAYGAGNAAGYVRLGAALQVGAGQAEPQLSGNSKRNV